MKTKISIFGGILVSGILLYFAFRNIDFGKLYAIYAGAHDIYIIPFIFTLILEMVFRAIRWKLLLDPAAPVRLWDAFRLEGAGLALNNVLPLRLGEVVRGTVGGKILGIPILTVFSTILVERALDSIVLFVLFVIAAKIGGLTGGLLRYDEYFWVLLIGLGSLIVALVFVDEIMSHTWFSGFFNRLPKVKRTLEKIALGVKAFHSFKTTCLIFLLAGLQWLMDALNYYWMAKAFGIDGAIDAFKSMALVFVGALAASVPAMPGYFGNYEFAIAKVLGTWGIGKEVGFAYATYIHVISYVLVTMLGLVFVYQMGHSVSRVWVEFGRQNNNEGC